MAIVSAIAILGLVLTVIRATTPTLRTAPVPDSAAREKGEQKPTVTDSENHYGLPTRLVIPKINVDAGILQMGLTTTGDMEAPKTDEEAGWYKYGPAPGNVGSAVIAGHLGVGGNAAVFRQLDKLIKGDTLSITDEGGQTATFIVTRTHKYDNDAAPSEVFASSAGAHLNLITCEGSWDASRRTYSQRLVVFTDKLN